MRTTEEMIEKIVAAVIGPNQAPKQSHFLRESLRHLIRVAQLEKEADVKRCVALSVGMHGNTNPNKASKIITRKILTAANSKQARLNFQAKTSG
jgi:hypothetical protein